MVSYGLGLTEILNTWEQVGIFAYALPFLMIFAVVFGILSKSRVLGRSKGVNATIAMTVGLLSLQWDYVTNFFSILLPYAGMGIGVLLVALILMGLVSEATWSKYVWFGIGVVIFFVVLFTALADFSWFGGGVVWVELWPVILAVVILLAFMALIIFGPKDSGGNDDD